MSRSRCEVCAEPLPIDRRSHRRYCGGACRVRAHRIRIAAGVASGPSHRHRASRSGSKNSAGTAPPRRDNRQQQRNAPSPTRRAQSAAFSGDVTVNYQREPVRCGKRKCRCATQDQSLWHGPYWYAYWTDPITGRARKKYIGKEFDPPVEQKTMRHDRRPPPGPNEWAEHRQQRRKS